MFCLCGSGRCSVCLGRWCGRAGGLLPLCAGSRDVLSLRGRACRRGAGWWRLLGASVW